MLHGAISPLEYRQVILNKRIIGENNTGSKRSNPHTNPNVEGEATAIPGKATKTFRCEGYSHRSWHANGMT